MKEKTEQDKKLEIQIDEQVATGQYINMAVVNHNDSEFVLDCIFVQPQAPKARVCSRLITSPRHAKRLMLALQHNLASFEKEHGKINLEASESSKEKGGPIH